MSNFQNGTKMTGTVRNFDTKKGYGFIKTHGIDEDIFVHHRTLEGEGYKNLYRGDNVSFKLYQNGEKGLIARNVRVLR